jgi:hypothetical protein
MEILLSFFILGVLFVEGVLEGHRWLWPDGNKRIWYSGGKPVIEREVEWRCNNKFVRPNSGGQAYLDLHAWRIIQRLVYVGTIISSVLVTASLMAAAVIISSYLLGLSLYTLGYNYMFYGKYFVNRKQVDAHWYFLDYNLSWIHDSHTGQVIKMTVYGILTLLSYIGVLL